MGHHKVDEYHKNLYRAFAAVTKPAISAFSSIAKAGSQNKLPIIMTAFDC